MYASSASALTSGSALTFDGTNTFRVNGGSSGFYKAYSGEVVVGEDATGIYYGAGAGVAPAVPLYFGSTGTTFQRWQAGGSEQMRLTSTGLGIGTSSPGVKLDVNGNIRLAQNNYLQSGDGSGGWVELIKADSSNNTVINNNKNLPIIFSQSSNGGEKMRLDSSGNLGLGVTPSAWQSGYTVFQARNTSIFTSNTTDLNFGQNVYINSGGNYTYISNGYATLYNQYLGKHYWSTAPSGTAGNAISFTQAMTLDASGNLGVGTTSPAVRLDVSASGYSARFYGDASNYLRVYCGSTYQVFESNGTNQFGYVNGAFFVQTAGTERARITSGGDLLVGQTAADQSIQGIIFNSYGTGRFITNGGADNVCLYLNRIASDGAIQKFLRNSVEVGSVSVTTSATAYNTSSDYRLKDNPQPLTGSGAFIDALKPKIWNWKADGSKGVGFIAHEVQAVSPGSVVGEKDAVDEEGKPIMQAMEYGSAEFIANIIAELQSLRQRVALLEGN